MIKSDMTFQENGTGIKNQFTGKINVQIISRDNCTECDELIENVLTLKTDFPEIKLEVLNIISEDIKQADLPFIVRITPALIVNGKLKCYGCPSPDKIKKFILT